MEDANKLLVVSRTPKVGNERKAILEAAGFSVISATDFYQVQQACKENGFWLAMIGHLIPPKEKRRVWAQIITSYPDTQILELFEGDRPELVDADYYLNAAEGLAAIPEKVAEILRSRRSGTA